MMSLVLDLPAELEKELSAEAEQLRLSLSEYALRLLSGERIVSPKPQTGAELVAYWQSAELVGTRPDISDAPGHGRALREQANRRERS